MNAVKEQRSTLVGMLGRLPFDKAQEIVDFAVFLGTRCARSTRKKRPIGLYRGRGKIHSTFYEPLPPDVLAGFDGRET